MSLFSVKDQIADACRLAHRSTDSVRLIAVSKIKPASQIQAAYDHGQRDFGENYADELIDKARMLSHLSEINWIFLGQLQSNKIQKLVEHAAEIQTVTTIKHARYIQRYSLEFKKNNFPVWIQINADAEAQKFGVTHSEASELAAHIKTQCTNLRLMGLMAIPPISISDKNCRGAVPRLYQDLIKLARTIGNGKISLGMSSDLGIAIAAGSDCVRIGTAIFGGR
ncbi:MAG: YggS family pyridoxal phosphate-dependent enzyme [Proteobacteria bacterium]|nr:YggS family pyridoxal phosphate-dependent enzyme [Pseudomonadota bacterium]